MTVTSVDSLYAECSDASISGGRNYTAYYRVQTDSRSDGPITAYTAVGIPSLNEYFQFGNDIDFGSFVYSYGATTEDRDSTLKNWIVSVNYQFRGVQDGQDQPPQLWDFPWQKPAIITGDGITTSEPLIEDSAGLVIVNSAGEIFRNEYRDRSFPTLVIQKNFQTISLSTYIDYADSTNDAQFFGLQADRWKLSFPRWRQLYFGNTKYYEVTFEFSGRPDGWFRTLINKGETYLEGGPGGTRKRFTDDLLRPLQEQNLLDAIGDRLEPFEEPVTRSYEVYSQKDFSALDIPTDF